jgi:hypothetical protein
MKCNPRKRAVINRWGVTVHVGDSFKVKHPGGETAGPFVIQKLETAGTYVKAYGPRVIFEHGGSASIDDLIVTPHSYQKNPLASGYSRATVGKNIAHMERAGHKAAQAIAAALKSARASFRKRFPKKSMPAHLRKTLSAGVSATRRARSLNPDIHIDIQSHNTGGRNVRAKNPLFKVLPGYKKRFISESQATELMNLYHLAKVALSGTKPATRYNRMLWASAEFSKLHPSVSTTAAYKDLDGLLS